MLRAIARIFLLLLALAAIQPLSAGAATPAVLTDEVDAAGEGADDHREFADAFRTHYASLRRYFERALGNHAEAEEATQETLLRLYARHRARPLPPGEVKPWLYAVARNHAIDVLRRHQRAEWPTEPDRLVERSDGAQLPDLTPPGLRNDFDVLRPLIERLPRRQQRLLGLRYRLNFTTAETADTLGMTCENVRQTERRALSFLRTRI